MLVSFSALWFSAGRPHAFAVLTSILSSRLAGASTTFPQQAGTIRKNGFLVINGRPCKVNGQAADFISMIGICRAHARAHRSVLNVIS